ncbi:hypothetical protein JCM10295v2_003717 [Rhodotorula toruloides]
MLYHIRDFKSARKVDGSSSRIPPNGIFVTLDGKPVPVFFQSSNPDTRCAKASICGDAGQSFSIGVWDGSQRQGRGAEHEPFFGYQRNRSRALAMNPELYRALKLAAKGGSRSVSTAPSGVSTKFGSSNPPSTVSPASLPFSSPPIARHTTRYGKERGSASTPAPVASGSDDGATGAPQAGDLGGAELM